MLGIEKSKFKDSNSWYFSQFSSLWSFDVNGIFMALSLYCLVVAKVQCFPAVRCTVPIEFGGNLRSVYGFICIYKKV